MGVLEDYFSNLQLEVQAGLAANQTAQGGFAHEKFTELAIQLLQDGEIVVDSEFGHIRGVGGNSLNFGIDGYSYDLADNSITCFISEYSPGKDLSILDDMEISGSLDALVNYVKIAVDIDEANLLQGSAYDLAQDIYFHLRNATTIRLLLISNRSFANWADHQQYLESIDLKPVFVDLWPIERLMALDSNGQGREEIEIDLTTWLNDGLPALRVSEDGAELETYLTVIPGQILADIYDNLGGRVLEGNVRSFLSASGRVNKGIKATLRAEPEKFLAYNNGISATATGVTAQGSGSIVNILTIEDLQIVNGGQTTATIHEFSRSKDEDQENLENISVQLKLIVLPPETASEMVPNISRYANTQNRIQDSDFFSNHAFHTRMEDISRRLICGSHSTEAMQSRWYYERSRGSYQSERLRLRTDVDRKKFDARFPKSKRITKTDFALYANCWLQKPQIVSRGPQKNFINFAKDTSEAFDSPETNAFFGDEYFVSVIGQGLLYQKLKEKISKAAWYESGYLTNIVSYAISKFSFESQKLELAPEWAEIWETQSIPEEILDWLVDLAQQVTEVLYSESRQQKNISEWAKSDQMWIEVKRLKVVIPDNAIRLMRKFGYEERAEEHYEVREKGKQLSEVEKYQFIYSVQSETWQLIKNSKHITVSPKESDILKLLEKGAVLSERQMDVLLALIDRAKREGVIRP